jgi:hypothetical protein
MDDDDFSVLTVPQLDAHCAPCSLSYCLYVLGIEASQEQIAKAAGISTRIYRTGMDEQTLMRAAGKFKVKTQELKVTSYGQGPRFAAKLHAHLTLGHPAILLIYDSEHWVAALGVTESGKIVIADPDDTDEAFQQWSDRALLRECWNEADEEPDQYYAILLKRRDGKPARWKITDKWLKLVERGSEETLEKLGEDIAEIALRAGGTRDGKGQLDLATVLKEYEDVICQDIGHWVGDDVGIKDLRGLYRDLLVTADSLRIRVPKTVNRYSLVAQTTAILTGWAWTDEL